MELNAADEDFDPPEDVDELNDTADELAKAGTGIQVRDRERIAETARQAEESRLEKFRAEAEELRRKEQEIEERERAAAEALNEERRNRAKEKRERLLKKIQERKRTEAGLSTAVSVNPGYTKDLGPSTTQDTSGTTGPVETRAEREARLEAALARELNEDLRSGEGEVEAKKLEKGKAKA